MNVHIGQIYIQPGVSYPFSHHFQKFLGAALTKRIEPSVKFTEMFGNDFELVFRVSAKAGIAAPEVRGPTVFKKTKDVEYTIFLTFDPISAREHGALGCVLRQLLEQTIRVLDTLGIDTSHVSRDSDSIIEQILSDPKSIV